MSVELAACPAVYGPAARLDAWLGDPTSARAAAGFAFETIVGLDEAGEFPAEAARQLQGWGFRRHLVPRALGGALDSYEGLLALLRVLSRRDLTTAIAEGVTVLGSTPLWLGGDPLQARQAATWVGAGDAFAMALSERGHGSDLVANELRAEAGPDGGFMLTGEKWLIGNASRSRAACVLARTAAEGGPRGFSLLLVDKLTLPDGVWRGLPRISTMGIRGADIGGFELVGARASGLVGALGGGLELTLKTLLITRTLTAGFSLGAADTALAVTLEFARERQLYGGRVLDIPHARRVLANAYADLLVGDALATACARGLHCAPGQAALSAAVVKALLPGRVDATIAELAGVLGARHYLREGHHGGVFQKLKRDHALIGVFDGNTIVNLAAVAQHLPRLARQRAKTALKDAELRERLALRHTPGAPLPALDATKLELFARADDPLVGLGLAREAIEALPPGATRETLQAQLGLLERGLAAVEAALLPLEATMTSPFKLAPEAFELARAYACLYAAATALWVWLHGRGLEPAHADGVWLTVGIQRLLAEAGVPSPRPAGADDTLVAALLAAHDARRPWGLVSWPTHTVPATTLGED